jgi:RNA polymerase sigma-70 factor (ECF subfamily)
MIERFEESRGSTQFPTTSWSVVGKAANPQTESCAAALASLCAAYWYPVYAFIRLKGFDPDEACDCTQEFFTRMIEKGYLASVDRSKGRFRCFLLACLTHFISNRRKAQRALKRGGGGIPVPLDLEEAARAYGRERADFCTPEALFEYRWALAVLDRTLQRLRREWPEQEFDSLKPFLVAEAQRGEVAAVAQRIGLSEGSVRVAVHRLRKRYRDALRTEIAEMVADSAEIEAEIRYLLEVISRHGRQAPRQR